MLQYVDSFSCSLNQDSGSIVIHFAQKEPHIEESTAKMNIISNPVTSIIMEKHSAIALLSILQDVYGDINSLQDD